MAHDVFISYSTKDKEIADAVCNLLEAHDVRCWYAPRDVRAGAEWTSAIMDGITRSRVTVFVWSSNSNKSKDVTREVKHAFRNEVTVIPFRVEDIAPPPALKYFLEDIHWLDALPPPFENHLQPLLKHVQDNLQDDTAKGKGDAVDAARKEESGQSRERAGEEARRRASEESRGVAAETAAARQSGSIQAAVEAGKEAYVQQKRKLELSGATESAPNYKPEKKMPPVEFADEEEVRLHSEARQFARLLVSEIRIYNQQKVDKGRSQGNLYGCLREDIDRSRAMYDKRVNRKVAAKYDYFHNEVLNTLAEGDASKLGEEYPGAMLDLGW